METAELIKKVRKIEIKSRGLSHNIFSGDYHSAFKGRGMSFSEVRGYQFGDDVRNIDWNVTARTGDPYIKVFEEERELTVMLLIDLSRSAFFGTVKQMKHEMATEIAAVLSFSAMQNNDKVGVLLFTDKVEKFIPPKKGKQHVLRIIRELLDCQPDGRTTDIATVLRFFDNVYKKRSIAFLISDFLTHNYEDALRIVARRHDLIGLRLYDPREQQLPKVGILRAVNAETGETQLIDTSSSAVRKHYENWYQTQVDYFNEVFIKSNVDTLDVRTDQDYVELLHRFFKARHK